MGSVKGARNRARLARGRLSLAQTRARLLSSRCWAGSLPDEHAAAGHVECLGRLLEVVGGPVDEYLAYGVCRGRGGIAGHVELPRGRGRARQRRQRRVGGIHGDAFHGHAEHFSRNLAQAVDLAGAQVGHTGPHDHRPVQLYTYPGLRWYRAAR